MLPAVDGIAYPVLPMDIDAHIRQASQRELDDCIRRSKVKGSGLLCEGPAAEAILEMASKLPARLIVVGTHGRTGLSLMALGSVAEAVLRASPCSVLVVRAAKTQ